LLRGGAFWPAIWNIALTQEDISQLAAGMPPTKVQPQALVAFWDFRGTTQERTWKDTAATLAEAGTNIGVMTPPNVVYRTVFKRRRRAAAAAAASTNVVRDRSSFRFMTGGTFRRMG
jgi:hypothetical protein